MQGQEFVYLDSMKTKKPISTKNFTIISFTIAAFFIAQMVCMTYVYNMGIERGVLKMQYEAMHHGFGTVTHDGFYWSLGEKEPAEGD